MRTCPIGAVLVTAWPLLTAGCLEPTTRLNAPPQGSSAYPNAMQDTYVYMVDQGMMHDLSVSDVHFVPHTSQLNGTGVRRLNRYAELLEGVGGAIHLDSVEDDEALTSARVACVSAYLSSSGLNMSNVKVEAGLPRGRGLAAPSALRILAEGTVDDTKQSGGGGSTPSAASSSSK